MAHSTDNSTDKKHAAAAESRIIELALPARPAARMLLRFEAVRHSLRSFEVRIFFDKDDASASTPVAGEPAYAGSFHMYGHGLPGETRVGAAAVIDGNSPFGGQRLAPFDAAVDVSEALRAQPRRSAAGGSLRATLVVVEPGHGGLPAETFRFDAARLEPARVAPPASGDG